LSIPSCNTNLYSDRSGARRTSRKQDRSLISASLDIANLFTNDAHYGQSNEVARWICATDTQAIGPRALRDRRHNITRWLNPELTERLSELRLLRCIS
jgi:hypothetical protein